MELLLQRRKSSAENTLGELFINGVHAYYTDEDVIREQPGIPVEKWKVYGKTAIPQGRYQVKVTPSKRFGKDMPQIMNVPGFDGIRIHIGNTSVDTDGCLLIGRKLDVNSIAESTLAFNEFFPKLKDVLSKGEEVWITIHNAA